ncbi:MAG: PfkB family carbohydrate kinase [Nitrosomonas sp.]
MKSVVFGEVLFDCFDDGTRVLGGAPFNVAWHLNALGQRPLMVSTVGKDRAGDEILQRMRAWNMDELGLQFSMQYPTGSVEVELQHGEPSYTILEPVAWDDIQTDLLPPMPAEMMLYHGTLALRNATNRSALQQIKRRRDMRVFVDANLRAPWWDRQDVLRWIADADWIKLNQHELQDLFPAMSSETEGIEGLFHETRANSIILTCGKDGAKLFRRDGEHWQIRPEQPVVQRDAVGAGDAFASICLLGILQHWPMQLILNRAQEFAIAVIGLRGATTDDPMFYQNFCEKWGM